MPDPDNQTASSSVEPLTLQLSLAGSKTPQEPAFTLTKDGVVVRENLTLPEWRDGLKMFKWAQDHLKIGFSTYISFGRLKFGKEHVDAALGQLEFDMPTVRAALDIGTIPLEMRHENLNAEHYVILARADGLSPAKRAQWAKKAADHKLSPSQLKASIDANEIVTSAVAEKNTHGVISIHGLSQEFDIWLRRVKGISGILKMAPEAIEDIVRELAPMAKLHHDLINKKNSAPAKKKSKKKAAKKKTK